MCPAPRDSIINPAIIRDESGEIGMETGRDHLHTLLVEAGKDMSCLSGAEIRNLMADFQSLLVRLDQQNRKLNQKLLEQTSELTESNRALQKKIEELNYSKHQLREREEKLNSIFNAAVEGIITIDRSGIIVSVNAAVKTIFGYGEDELIGRNIGILMPSSQGDKHDNYLKNYIRTRKPKAIGRIREVEGIRKDGTAVPVDLSLAAFTIDGAKYFTGIFRDVSLRKLREQHDKEHLEELSHVTRLGLMGEMASGIAHEVNQPLTAIAAYAQVCLGFLQARNPDLNQLADILLKTHQQALRAGQIIHRMRDFVRSKTIHRSSVDINDLIQNGISLCASDIKQNSIALKFEPAKDIPVVYIDEVQIEQVLINLIRNSIDALKNPPPSEPRILTIRTHLNNHHYIEVSIKDNGPGIPEAEQKKILAPFYTTKNNGMGMGLSISRSIVEAHNGMLRFASKEGKGSTFYFTLPTRRNANDY